MPKKDSDVTLERKTVPMVGKLKANQPEKYAVLKVPQGFADAIFDAIYEEGMEKPDDEAHISVMNSEETTSLDMPLKEHNQIFEFTLDGIESVKPEGWDEMEKVWFVKCISPQLEDLRKKYGLTPLLNTNHNFHITIAVKPQKDQSLTFANTNLAIQYLSDLYQKKVIIKK